MRGSLRKSSQTGHTLRRVSNFCLYKIDMVFDDDVDVQKKSKCISNCGKCSKKNSTNPDQTASEEAV